jgi:alkylation response protein AidB-like acyl-CoA dehydrogenase
VDRATHAVVATSATDTVTVVRFPSAELSLRPVAGLDPDFGLVQVVADIDGRAWPDAPAADWEHAVVLARLAVSHELLGAARTMLALAREHALQRVQYGQPISRFQAVRHRLAETLVAIEAADAVVDAAHQERSPELASVAKSLAGRGARTAARHCQQVLAGIGFTAEHPFPRYYRRALLLDELFGSAHTLTAEFGSALARSRRLPSLLPL